MGWILGPISLVLVIVNTLLWCIPFYVVGIINRLSPARRWRGFWSRVLMRLGEGWVSGNAFLLAAVHRIEWDIRGTEGLRHDAWYLVSCNHQTWTDIPVLQTALNGRAPFLKFFLKKELIWVPVMGPAWWFLDFPFMKRYSRAELEARPELRGEDLRRIRRACEHFLYAPVSVLNFVEGTRFTAAKHRYQESPYQRLLKPKVGGLAAVVGQMGDALRSLLDITIVYPGGVPTFWDLLAGRMDRVVVDVVERPIPPELRHGDYENDPVARARFQEWIQTLWGDKDVRIGLLLEEGR